MSNSPSEIKTGFSSFERKIAIVVFLLLWCYLFLRAIYTPVLHDEIATFFYYIQSDNYMPPWAHWDANNHVLNSLLANITYHLFGSSPLSLRLPNVLAFVGLFYGAYQLAKRLKHKVTRWSMLLALVASHYILEYMAECRGYGISIAFLVLVFYQFILIREKGNFIHYTFLILFLILGTSANLTLIIPSVLIIGGLFLHIFLTYFKTQKATFLKHSIAVVIMCSPFLLLAKQSFLLKDKGALYYGGDSGFYDISVKSLSNLIIGNYNTGIATFITLLFLSLCGYIIARFIKDKTLVTFIRPTVFFSLLLVGSVLSIIILSRGLKVNYPEDRAAMYLYPLFITAFAYMIDNLSIKKSKVQYFTLILCYFPVLFISQISLKNTVFSSEERTSTAIFEYIQNAPNEFKFPHTVGAYKTQEFCWYFLNNRAGGTQGKIHTNYHIALDANFQIVRDGRITDSILFDYYKPVVSDNAVNLTLFERKEKLKPQLILEKNAVITNGFTEDEYHNILEIKIDTLTNQTLYIGAEMTLDAPTKPFIAWVSVTCNDSEGNSLYQDYIPLDWIRKNWDGATNNVKQGILLHHIPENSEVLKFYIWNIDKTRYSIPNGKCYLYKLGRDFSNQY